MEYHICISDNIQSYENAVDVIQKDEHGTTIDKFKMGLGELTNSLLGAMEEQKTSSTPFLPRNCVRFGKQTNSETVFIELPKRQWKVNFDDKDMMIGFPRLLIQYIIQDKSVIRMCMYALKVNDVLTDDTVLNHFPFTNVEHESGEVCMGTNTFPVIEHLKELEQLHLLFFAAPFGVDYGFRVASKVNSQASLFERLENQDFDEDLLLPTNKTFVSRFPM